MLRYCTRCGVAVVSSQRFCRKCGSRIDSGELVAAESQRFVTKVDRPVHETVATPSRASTDPMPSSIVTVALRDSGVQPSVSADAPTDQLVHPPPPTRQIQPSGSEVRSLPTASRLGSSPVVKIINVAAGLAVFLVAVGLVFWYLGIGRQRARNEPAGSDAKIESNAFNQGQTGSTTPAVDAPNPVLPERAGAEVNPRVNPKGTVAKANEPMPIQPTAASAVAPSTPEAHEVPAPPKANPLVAAPSGDEHVRLGRDLLNARNYDRALVEFRSAARLEPSNNDVHYLAGLAYDKLGQRSEALEEFSRCKSGPYAAVAAKHVERLSKQLRKNKQ